MTDHQERPGPDTPGALAVRQVQAGRSPVADLIDRHRAEMREIWTRHVAELSRVRDRAA